MNFLKDKKLMNSLLEIGQKQMNIEYIWKLMDKAYKAIDEEKETKKALTEYI